MLKINPTTWSVGVQDPKLRIFDIVMHTPHGTTYNAYLVKGSEKAALVETVKLGFHDEYFKNVEAVMPFSQIDYLILNHTEPDHAGTIPLVLDKNPDMTVIGTSSAIMFLKHMLNRPFKSQVVKAGDSLDLGDRSLTFHPAPNLHWPDTMFTFDPQEKTLFCCDFFGAHMASDPLLLSQVKDRAVWAAAQEAYYNDIMGPFSQPFVQNGLKIARELDPALIATGHGPILDSDLDEVYRRYEKWSTPLCNTGAKKVAIIYVSAYNYTRKMAQKLKETLDTTGLEVTLYDAIEHDKKTLVDAVMSSDGVLLGSPTIVGDALYPIVELLISIHPVMVKGKLFSAFGSYGWSGEAVPFVMDRLAQLKVRVVDPVKVRFNPSDEDMAEVVALAERFAEAL